MSGHGGCTAFIHPTLKTARVDKCHKKMRVVVGWISRAHPPCVANKVGAIFKVDALHIRWMRFAYPPYVFGG
jgi:hypothetical protein